MSNTLDDLKETAKKLAVIDARRAGLIQYRDQQITKALQEGATWVTIQAITGLSPRGLALAIKRADK